LKFPKFPSFDNIINSRGNELVSGNLVQPTMPCRVCFWPATRERLPSPGLDLVALVETTYFQQSVCKVMVNVFLCMKQLIK